MTLGIFTDDFYPYIGGMGRYVYEVTRRLPANKFVVFSPCQNKLPYHRTIAPPFLHAKLRNISFSLWLGRNVRQLITRNDLGRINLQCGPGGLFLLKKPPVPVIATCYHTWWQQSHYVHKQFWKKIFIPFERRTYRIADKIICISEDSRDILLKKYGIQPRKAVVVSPGIDTQQFFPIEAPEKIPDSILYVGRVDKRKGVDFLISAMPGVVNYLPTAKLYIGGIGKDLPALKAYVQTRGLAKNIDFLGFIPDASLNLWYNKVQCAVIPSVFEGFGLTAVEAMAAGTSVICTDVDSLRHIVDDGRCGYVVKYNDRKALSAKILNLLTDPDMRRQFSKKGRARVLASYDWQVIIGKLEGELFG
jgi:glycosyltransferase involved in cell wall biosynthesis